MLRSYANILNSMKILLIANKKVSIFLVKNFMPIF